MENVRILEMQDCKMVSSGVGMFGEQKFQLFESWIISQNKGLFPKDFLFWEGNGFHWVYMYEDGMNIPKEFDIIDFKGGLYAVTTGIDKNTDRNLMNEVIDNFLSKNGFERDKARFELGNIITSSLAKEIMGYEQMDYYTPIKRRD